MSERLNYADASRDNYDTIEFRLHRSKEVIQGEWFDGERIDPATIPEGKYLYETRHSDKCDNLSMPASIKNTSVIVNFCGSVVTTKPITYKGKELTTQDEIGITRSSVYYDSGIDD